MKIKRILQYILYFLFIGIFIYSIYNIYILVTNHHSNKKEVEEIQEEVIINKEEINNIPTEKKEDDEYQLPELELDFKKLKELNSDTVGWIEIRNTNINYPFVQANDNDYYLTHSFYRYENVEGWIYLNYLNNPNLRDPNSILFGHDTHGRNMFSDLKKLYEGLLGNYIPITIYLENETYHYETVAIFLVEEHDNQFLKAKLSQKDLEDALSKSKYDFNKKVDTTNHFITLSTCYNSSSQKVILIAVQI
ncbi:MAG: class B sortase [Bacilli bacterium]|nr:class B sortase [Bacilli bacterium]